MTPEDILRGARPGGAPVRYPESDQMGESGLQLAVRELLMRLLRSFFLALGRKMLVGGDQFFYYAEGDPAARVAPDVYVVDDEETPLEEVRSWKTWEHEGRGPAFAVEVVSRDYRKDYDQELVERYQRLGVKELFRYDPERVATPPRLGRAERRRSLLTHFVRDDSGLLVPRPTEGPGRAKSALYDFWLVHVSPAKLRLGTGPLGEASWPSDEERAAAEAERAAAEAERASAEAERAAAEAERASAAEERVRELEAELARLRGGGS